MPRGRPNIDLTVHKELIIAMYNSGGTTADIANFLENRRGLSVQARTIERRLQEWQIRKRTCKIDSQSEQLRARIVVLFFECGLSDKEILFVL